MSGIIGTEWLNSNALRNYPLSQLASQQSTNSSFILPDDLFVDMKLAVPYVYGLNTAQFYISSITIYPQGFVFEVGYDGGSGGITGWSPAGNVGTNLQLPSVAVSSPVAFSGFTEYSSVSLKGVSNSQYGYDFSQISGVAVIGSLAGLEGASGTLTFDIDSGRLESTVISMGAKRISGIRVVNSGFTTPVLSGQISLQSGSNHSIAVTSSPSGTYTALKFNAVDGGGLTDACDCNEVELSPCIRTINGIHGDAQGNVSIVGGDCINVSTVSSGIVVSDTCAKPCCGCNELQVVVTDVDSMSAKLDALANQITVLAASVSQLQNVCLASSIDPTSCAQDGG